MFDYIVMLIARVCDMLFMVYLNPSIIMQLITVLSAIASWLGGF